MKTRQWHTRRSMAHPARPASSPVAILQGIPLMAKMGKGFSHGRAKEAVMKRARRPKAAAETEAKDHGKDQG
ncbi:hypothetical protein [Bradyrhizobium ottawaense]|uniref:hypothetical protein n=1 Tax=Bradyrhizobium ottawaense TaxID=931866 RepID=UPI0030F3D57A